MKKSLITETIVGFGILAAFLIYFSIHKNYEFFGYIFPAAILLCLLIYSDKYYNYPRIAVWGLILWILSHMLGGSIYFAGTRLYEIILINLIDRGGELVVLKYDQIIHFYCFVVITFIIYFISKKYLKKQNVVTIILVILAGMGVGALNEIIEFMMVLFANSAATVGGYYNNTLDLVFNMLGAILGAIIATGFGKK